MLRVVINQLREGTESIRNILKSIKPESASLNIQKFKQLVAEIQVKSGINFDLIFDVHINDIDYKIWQIVHLNLKEAFINMIKYSEASSGTVKFEKLNKHFKISVKDNGIGCGIIKNGMGIEGMLERVSELDGQLITDGTAGFSVILIKEQSSGSS